MKHIGGMHVMQPIVIGRREVRAVAFPIGRVYPPSARLGIDVTNLGDAFDVALHVAGWCIEIECRRERCPHRECEVVRQRGDFY